MALVEALSDRDASSRAIETVMGGTAHVVVVTHAGGSPGDRDDLLRMAEQRLRLLEARWSRFLVGSEISSLNASAGVAITVTADTIALVRAMVSAWNLTDGIVDAALLRELVAAGYAHSILDPTAVTVVEPSPGTGSSLGDIEIDDESSTVCLPPGLALDPGGIGKGLAADLVVEELMAAGAEGALVEISGDLRVAGDSPSGRGWFIDIADPQAPGGVICRVGIVDGGVATSSVLKRRWVSADGVVRHHLIGRDGRPVHHGLATATAVVGTAALAEVMAKIALLVGEDEGLGLLDAWQVPALVVRHDGTVVTTRYWSEVQA